MDSEIEISFVSSAKIRSHPMQKKKIKQTSILKYGVVYGANASGKSNLVDAFAFIKNSVQSGIPVAAGNDFCRNRKKNREKPSSFEIQFTVGKTFFAYGFSVILSQRKVTEEWLYELLQNGEARKLFDWEQESLPSLGEGIALSNEEQLRFSVYSQDFTSRKSGLFLTEMNHGKIYDIHFKGTEVLFGSLQVDCARNIIVLDLNTSRFLILPIL